MMKLTIKKDKLINLLKMLQMDNMISSSIISVDKDKLVSVQREQQSRALRFLKVNKNYFEDFDCPEEESIKISTQRMSNYVENVLPGNVLTLETKDEKLLITGGDVKIKFNYIKPKKKDISKTYPFDEVKDGVIIIGENETPLNVHFSINLDDFKKIANVDRCIDTKLFSIRINEEKNIEAEVEAEEDDEFKEDVGDMYEFPDTILMSFPSAKITMGEKLKVAFSFGFRQIASTFRETTFEVQTATDAPAWFVEKTDEYELGVLIPPYVEDNGEEETDDDDAFIEATLERLIPMLQKRHPELFKKSEDV